MDSELLKQLVELNDKYLEVISESHALKQSIKDVADLYNDSKTENERLKVELEFYKSQIGVKI